MKARLLFTVLAVVLGLAGCGASSSTAPSLTSLGGAVEIATIGSDKQVLTYNESLEVVCIENALSTGIAARASMSAFSCWETNVAPKKMQELVARYLSGKK